MHQYFAYKACNTLINFIIDYLKSTISLISRNIRDVSLYVMALVMNCGIEASYMNVPYITTQLDLIPLTYVNNYSNYSFYSHLNRPY